MHVSKDSLAAVVQQPATAGSAATAGAQQAPVVVPAAGPRVDLGAVLGAWGMRGCQAEAEWPLHQTGACWQQARYKLY